MKQARTYIGPVFLMMLIFSIPGIARAAIEPENEPEIVRVNIGHAVLNTWVWGSLERTESSASKETILALPGSGSDVSRYRLIGPLIAAAGYRFVAINQRGIMGSSGNLNDLDLHDYAADVVAVANALNASQFHMLGWAMGNRTARVVATDSPERVTSLTLLAAGGLAKPLTEPGELGRLLGQADIPKAEKSRLAQRTLFSHASPEALVGRYVDSLQYWYKARESQRNANLSTPIEQWWAGGNAPMLIVQGLDDKTAPPENGELMKADFGDRVTLVNLEDAGHLMGLEKPEETAAAIINFLQQHPL